MTRTTDPIDQYLALHKQLARLLEQSRNAMENGDLESARHLLKQAERTQRVMEGFESSHKPTEVRPNGRVIH